LSSDCDGGEFAFYPDGAEGEPSAIPVRFNTGILLDTDSVFHGSPQWQIESLRRLEIPEDIQKKHGLKPLGAADGPVKSAILGENNARIYKYERRAALATDRIAAWKEEYEKSGPARSNLRYGYVVRSHA